LIAYRYFTLQKYANDENNETKKMMEEYEKTLLEKERLKEQYSNA